MPTARYILGRCPLYPIFPEWQFMGDHIQLLCRMEARCEARTANTAYRCGPRRLTPLCPRHVCFDPESLQRPRRRAPNHFDEIASPHDPHPLRSVIFSFQLRPPEHELGTGEID